MQTGQLTKRQRKLMRRQATKHKIPGDCWGYSQRFQSQSFVDEGRPPRQVVVTGGDNSSSKGLRVRRSIHFRVLKKDFVYFYFMCMSEYASCVCLVPTTGPEEDVGFPQWGRWGPEWMAQWRDALDTWHPASLKCLPDLHVLITACVHLYAGMCVLAG